MNMKVRHWGFLIVAFCVIVTVAALFALSWPIFSERTMAMHYGQHNP